ncbi:MAG: ATP-binding protein, partial [Dehalococcoidia bacterium]|nr:ATP-binding protein [Dehalococcoidia bacterium]
QNALDAIDIRKQKEPQYTPALWINIDLKESTVSVTDNGIGFSQDEFVTFLAPNVSYKKRGDRGNKGVGATYLAYGFNSLQIGTKTPAFSFVGTIEGGREWVEDDASVKARPKIQKSKPIHDAFNAIDQGSTFTLRLVGEFIRPRDLTYLGATNAEQWDAALRIRTPLGGVYFNRECLLRKCVLKVVDEKGQETSKDISLCEYIYPHTVISACKDVGEIRRTQQELLEKGKDASKLPDSFNKLNGLYGYWSYDDIVSDKGILKGDWSASDKELAIAHKLMIYGFIGYSMDIWDKYNDEILGLRKKGRILRGGVQLATNFMPQGDLVVIPLTRNVWFQNVTHVVAHFEEAEPDLGRKGFQPELHNLAQRVGVAVVSQFNIWRKLLKGETGAPPDIVGFKDIHDWIKEQEDHEKTHPLIITRKDVFLPMKEPSITSQPTSEQDVVALFNQLLAGGVIRGLKLMATSQHEQYDSICRFVLQDPVENHTFHKEKNPLGISGENITNTYVSAPGILEYKYSFNGLVAEIENGDKDIRHIQLVVAWEMGNSWTSRYEITPLLHLDNLQHRYFHGGTHIVRNASTGETIFPAIILSELIDYINDPDSVQGYQKATYME